MRIKIKDGKYYFLLALKTTFFYFVFLFFLFFTPKIMSGATDYFKENFMDSSNFLVLGETVLKVEIADSVSERKKGLSGRKKLADNSGLFFIFDKEDKHGIWMKDMNFPIDILWFNKYSELIQIEENVKPESYPEVFHPNSKSLYILEVNSGFVKKKNITLGDTIDLR